MKKSCLLLLLIVIFLAGNVWASGFRVPEQGATSMGMSNAWVAQANDPSAISINPAGIAQISTPSLGGGFLVINPSVEHTASDGTKEDVENNFFFPPNIYATCNMGTSNWFFGIGVSTPFGLATEWADDSFARYSSTLSEIELININPTLAYKVNDNLLVGFGVDYYRSTVTLKRKIAWGLATFGLTGDPSSLAIPDGDFQLKGDGDGWGYNAGILYKFADNYSFGFAYRSGITVDYEGDADLSKIGGAGLLLYGGNKFSTTGTADLDYPAMAQIGFAARVMPALLVELDVEWTGWSSYDKLELNFDSPLIEDTTSIKDWDDTLTYRLGLEYTVNEFTDIRAGYLYDKSPIPDEHFDTLLPDGDSRHGLSIGLGYRFGQFSLDTSYLALLQTEREIKQNNAEYELNPLNPTDVRGKYKGFTHLFAINLSYLF